MNRCLKTGTKMRCVWKKCNGSIGEEDRCISCGRSQDIKYEKWVETEQAKDHTGQHTYGGNCEYYYLRRLSGKSRAGRKSKWE